MDNPSSAMLADLPLSVLLSQTLIAITQEFEHEGAGTSSIPSLAVWSTVLRFVGDKGIDPRELPRLACLSKRAIRAAVGNVERRGWAAVESNLTDSRKKILRITVKGQHARKVWGQFFNIVDERWRTRFGEDLIATLRTSLESLVNQLDLELPHYPVGYGPADMSITGGNGQDWSPVPRGEGDTVSRLPLSALLSQTLVAFTMEYEQEAGMALALSANIIRFVDDEGIPLAMLTAYSGKTIYLGTLERHGYIVVERDPADKQTQIVHLTRRGQKIHDGYRPLLAEIELRWQTRYGTEVIQSLRRSLEVLVGQFDRDLPHHPMQTSLEAFGHSAETRQVPVSLSPGFRLTSPHSG